jgi:integrase
MFINEYGAKHCKNTVVRMYEDLSACLNDAVEDELIKKSPFKHIELFYVEKTLSVQELKARRDKKKWLELKEYYDLKNFVTIWLMQYLTQPEVGFRKSGKVNKNEIPSQYYTMLIFIALQTGCRLSEILGITFEDIDFENRIISINKSWDYKDTHEFDRTKNI